MCVPTRPSIASDLLDLISGKTWIKLNSPVDKNQPEMGSMLRIAPGKVSDGRPLEIIFDWAAPASISPTSGEYGSSHKVLGQGVECYYRIHLLDKQMTMALKKGDSSCLSSSYFGMQVDPRIISPRGSPIATPPANSGGAPKKESPSHQTSAEPAIITPPTLPHISADKDTPSFDCNTNRRADEVAVCGNQELRKLDRQLSSIYKTVSAAAPTIQNSQRAWITRRASCGNDEACLIEAYKSREIELKRIWMHNNSAMQLVIGKDNLREFVYEVPRSGLEALGIVRGEILFSGKKVERRYEGHLHFFSRKCGKIPYKAVATWSDDQTVITIRARRPKLDEDCDHEDEYIDEVAVFTFVKYSPP